MSSAPQSPFSPGWISPDGSGLFFVKITNLRFRIQSLNTQRVRPLERSIGVTPRVQGRLGMERRATWLMHHPLCKICHAAGIIRSAEHVDHIQPLSLGGSDDDSNKQSLCIPCHKEKTRRDGSARWLKEQPSEQQQRINALIRPNLRPSKADLTIVCGPAGGGKSTYIKHNAQEGDLLIDMDAIRTELGIGVNQWDIDTLERSLARRLELLQELSTDKHKRAWFIVGAATSAERIWWRQALQPHSIVVVLADLNTCIARITRTRSGDRKERSVRATRKWWAQFTNDYHETVIDTTNG